MANKPNAKIKISKNGSVTFQSNVNHVQHTIEELINAANRDVGKYIKKVAGEKLSAVYTPIYSRGKKTYERKGKFVKKFVSQNLSYWARKRENDLQIGFKNFSWFTQQELGDYNYPKLAILRNTVFENIPTINQIQSQYITKLSEKNPTIPEGEDTPID